MRGTLLNVLEKKVIILSGDLLIICGALFLFVDVALDDKFVTLFSRVFLFSSGFILFFFLSYILDFYNLERISNLRYFLALSFFITTIFVLFVFLFAILLFDASFWRWPLVLFFTMSPTLIFLWRFFIRSTFKIIPNVKRAFYLYDSESEKSKDADVVIINGQGLETFYKVRLCKRTDRYTDIVVDSRILEKIDSIILGVKDFTVLPPDLKHLVLSFIAKGKEVLPFSTFYENVYEALPVKSNSDNFYEILQLKNKQIRYFQAIFTFTVNFLLVMFLGSILLVCIPFVYCINLFFNQGPLFYGQKRVGQFGKEFMLFKFRTMVINAEADGIQMAKSGDTRITLFGKILRKFRVDEMPQIISVIKGKMSLIGPRPERKYFVDQIVKQNPVYNIRHLIKPGITGWAQVKFKYGENLDDSLRKLEFDLFYIKNKSIVLDIRILFKTITTVLFSRGV